jgi:hypothetical protein
MFTDSSRREIVARSCDRTAIWLVGFSALFFFFGCKQSPAPVAPPADVPTFRSPTATEVFNLRSKCAELGEKIMKNTVVADALTKGQLSHYEPKTNRCYVQLTVQSADLAKDNSYFQQYLLDGQTGQQLAVIRREKGIRFAQIFIDPSPLNGNSDEMYLDASAFISKMMADDRQQ